MPVDSRALLAVLVSGAACVPTNPDPTVSGTTGSETTDPMPSTSSDDPTTSSTSTSSESSSTTTLDPTLDTSSEATEVGSTTGETSSSTSTSGDTSSSSDTTDASSSSTSGESSTGDALESTDTGDDTEGDDFCETMLMRTHVGRVQTHHDGDRFITLDEAHNLVLWETETLAVLFEERNVADARIEGGVLVYDTIEHETVYLVDAADASLLGSVPYQHGWGIADEGAYVWTAGANELHVYEADGSERWSLADAFSGVEVLALADALHVYAPLQNQSEVLHFSADAGVVDSDAFVGTFGGWFADAPRYWANQGQAYRVYDIDNGVLLLELGAPQYGWGSRLVLGTDVVDLADPSTVLAQVAIAQGDGPALFDGANIVHLDSDPVVVEPLAGVCCVGTHPSLGYSDGAWTLAGDDGLVVDHLGRAITAGEAVAIAGSNAGRVALAMHNGVMHVAEVSDECVWDEVATFPREGRHMEMSGDGSTLLSTERWQEGWTSTKDGTRVYALPDGDLLAGYQTGLMSDSVLGHDVSHDGAVWSRVVGNTGTGQYTVYASDPLLSGWSVLVPRISANGTRVAVSDHGIAPWLMWDSSVTYLYEGDVFTGVADGVNHGFIDDEHVLVARYVTECDPYCHHTLLGSDVVDMTGAVVAASSLPDVRDLKRIEDGAALGVVHPDRTAVVYDVMNGTLLWEGPSGATVEVAGPNHVFLSTGTRVEVIAWR